MARMRGLTHPGTDTASSGLAVTRGVNPAPHTGWPWCLTPYEIEYVREFNARPPRDESWPATPADERRLDDEADAVREQKRARVRRSWPRTPVLALTMTALVAGACMAGLGVVAHSDGVRNYEVATQLKADLNG